MVVLLVIHLALGTAIVACGDRLARRAFVAAAVAPACTLVWAASRSGDARDGAVNARIGWVPSLGLSLDLRLDAFALVMVVLISGVGLLVSSMPSATSRTPTPARRGSPV